MRDPYSWVTKRVEVDPLTGCWNWKKATRKGYGAVRDPRDGRVRQAHKVVYELLEGPYPDEEEGCHGCDNPRCVRPHWLHVRTGTKSFNLQEAWDRGRRGDGKTTGLVPLGPNGEPAKGPNPQPDEGQDDMLRAWARTRRLSVERPRRAVPEMWAEPET